VILSGPVAGAACLLSVLILAFYPERAVLASTRAAEASAPAGAR
jgi:hypothetical protein